MAFSDAFRMSMKPDDANWYYWAIGGGLAISPTPQYIQIPNKWKETENKWKRSIESRGLIRGIAAPYEFVDTTASLLRTIFYSGTIESKVLFLIERLNTDTMEYEDFFNGEVDLSTTDDGVLYNSGSVGVSAAVIEGGIGTMLDAAGDTDYSIELLPTDCDYVKMDGLRLREIGRASW